MNNQLDLILQKYKSRFKGVSDAFFFPDIPEKKQNKLIKNHKIEYGIKVHFHSGQTVLGFVLTSSVITDKYFSFKHSDLDEYFKIGWDKIHEVLYYGNEFHFILDQSDPSRTVKYKGEDILTSIVLDSSLGEIFAKLLTEIAGLFENEDQNYYKEVKAALQEGDKKTFEEKSEKYIKKYGEDGDFSSDVHLLRADYFFKENRFENALKEINFCEHYLEEGLVTNEELAINIIEKKADILLNLEYEYEALSIYAKLIKEYPDRAQVNTFRAKAEIANTGLQRNFLNINYSSRKLILIDDQQTNFSSKEFKVILKDKLPALKFPIGHPISKELYVGHPYNPKVYIPLSSFEENLFMDRFQEFSYFLQSLGATKISIVNKRGAGIGIAGEVSGQTSFNVTTLVAESKTTKEFSTKTGTESQNFKHISRTQIFSPVKKPFLPKNLVWYPHETSWQRLYEQRVNGNILNHSEIISTEQNQVVTRNEKRSIQQALEYYLIEAGASHSIDAEHMFREKETTEWVINVEFAPIETLLEEAIETNILNNNDNHLSNNRKDSTGGANSYISEIEMRNGDIPEHILPNELKYQTRVQVLVEDSGKIAEEDRRILERVRKKLEISEKRAFELEQQLLVAFQSVYSEEELQFIEEIKFCLEDDGEISEKERQVLELEREELGISVQRAKEIEEEILKNKSFLES